MGLFGKDFNYCKGVANKVEYTAYKNYVWGGNIKIVVLKTKRRSVL